VVFQGVGPGHAILGTVRFEVEIRDSEEVQLRIDDRRSGTGEAVFHERNRFDDFGEILIMMRRRKKKGKEKE
jgi:bifunctional N-acetylglucosamine-1-phosphate-uridyltransferase/glucosamine-1-phosphate-acetyltransferase GlmU-like protein